MGDNKRKIINYLEEAKEINISETLLSAQAPKNITIHNIPRLLLIVRGNVEVSIYRNHRIDKIMCGPGAALYCREKGYLYTKNTEPSQSISLSYYGDYIRSMFIDYDGVNQPPTDKDTYYHTDNPLSQTGYEILRVLDRMAEDNVYNINVCKKIFESLLLVSIDDIRASKGKKIAPSSVLWHEINLYMRSHTDEIISRGSIAKLFRVSPSYISHLFKRYGGKDFTTVLTCYRLERAAELLKSSRLSLDEISEKCCFKYTSYFLRRFRKFYGITPGSYRNSLIASFRRRRGQ